MDEKKKQILEDSVIENMLTHCIKSKQVLRIKKYIFSISDCVQMKIQVGETNIYMHMSIAVYNIK